MTDNSIKTKLNSESTPWYKIGMVWLMIGLPFIVVVASLTTAVIAHKNAPILVPTAGTHGQTE